MGWTLRLASGLGLAVLLLAAPAAADNGWKTSSSIWKIYDTCTKQALKQFPDYTPESTAKREKARRTCLEASNLPAEGGTLPPQTQRQHP